MTDKKKMAGLLGMAGVMAGLMAGASDLLGYEPRNMEPLGPKRGKQWRSAKERRKRRQAKRDRKINRQRRK